jgi:hypothetical protein
MKFYIPRLDDPSEAEARWAYYLESSPAPADSGRVCALEYEHGDSRFEVKVGQPRKEFKRKTGPRGGYIKNADYASYGYETGTEVSAIVDARGDLLFVWSFGPPFGGWASPSLVGRHEVRRIEYFEPPEDAG